MSAASTITRTNGSVPDGRSSTRPVDPSSPLRLGDRGSDIRGGLHPRLVHVRNVDEDLRQPLHDRGQLPQRTAGLRDPRRQQQPGQRAVTRGRVVEDDDVPGLLAAEGVPVLLHLLQDVPVTDRGLHQPDARPLHRQLEAEVGHHGGHHRVRPQRGPLPHGQREHGEDLVAVDLLAGVVHGQAAVGVTVVRDTEVRAVLDDRGLQLVQVGRAAAVVDVEAVRLGADRDDLRARPGERLRRDPRGRAVRFVQDDLQPVEPVGQHRQQVGDVLLEALVVRPHAPDTGARRPLPRLTVPVRLVHRLDLVLQLVGELVTAAGEELDAVVRHGVVARGEHHPEVGAQRAGQVRHRRRRQHADAQGRPRPRWPGRRPRPPPGTPRTRAGPARPPLSACGPRRCPPRPARAPRRRRGRAPSRPSDPRWRHRARRPCRRVVPLVLPRKHAITQAFERLVSLYAPGWDKRTPRGHMWRAAGAFGVRAGSS